MSPVCVIQAGAFLPSRHHFNEEKNENLFGNLLQVSGLFVSLQQNPLLMATRKKKKYKFTESLSSVYDKYWKAATVLVASITGSFWLGTYYEEVKKEREITEMEDRHSMELINMKEEYMNKYLDLREKILYNANDSTNGNKKN